MKTTFRIIIAAIALVSLAACAAPTPVPTAPPIVQSIVVPQTVIASAVPAATPTNASSATATRIESTATSAAPKPTALKAGDYDQSIALGGQTRTYILHIPFGYGGSKAVPLEFVLHGYGGSAKEVEGNSGMNAQADKENFIVMYPNGTGEPRGWNAGITPSITQRVDDVAFIRTLIDKFEKELSVDSRQIYVAGFSNGAMMTYRLGADLSDRLAAIAVVEGTLGTKQPDGSSLTIPTPAHPVPVIVFHSEQDTAIPYNGGQGNFQLFFPPVADAISFWVKNDACDPTPQKETSANGNIIRADYGNCAGGSEVLFYTIVNGVHEWPTLQGRAQFSATDAVATFFARHIKQ